MFEFEAELKSGIRGGVFVYIPFDITKTIGKKDKLKLKFVKKQQKPTE